MCACHLYNDGLVSSVNNALSKMQLGVSEEFKFKEEKLPDEIENALRNRLNAFLFYDRISHAFVAPGDVFAMRGGAGADANLLKAILRDFGANCELLDSISQSENIKLCKVIVTPLCDVAQNKKLTVPNVCKFDRYAWAVLACGDMRSSFKNPKTDYAYNVLKGFEYDGVVYDLLVRGEIELSKNVKGELISMLYVDTMYEKIKRPLCVGLSMTTASVVKCLSKEINTISLPSFP